MQLRSDNPYFLYPTPARFGYILRVNEPPKHLEPTPAHPVFLHVDMDAFFAAVEQHDHPEWRGLPVVVGSPADERGVVSTCSYEARKFGIHSAMPSSTAFKRCPTAIFVRPRMARYKELSRQIMTIFERVTPFVEPISIDEAFLDITGALHFQGSAREIAEWIKKTIKEETGLTASVGIAPNKFLAKIASDLEKPNGLSEIPVDPNEIARFIAPLPLSRMWGVGPKSLARFKKEGMKTFEDLQQASLTNLTRVLGERQAEQFKALAFGIDPRVIEERAPEKSISNETTFKKDVRERAVLDQQLIALCDKVSERLRHAGFYARTVHLKIKWSNLQVQTRQLRLAYPACDTTTLLAAAHQLFNAFELTGSVRLIGFGVSKFSENADAPTEQLSLFDNPAGREADAGKKERLSRAIDAVHQRFGDPSLKRAIFIEPEDSE